MGSNFFSTTIGEQITLQRGFDITKKEQQEGNVPVVSSGGISSYHNVSKVEAPGVVLGRKGTLGTVFFVEKDFWPHDTSLWVKDFKGNNPQFVYYFFKGMSAELKKMDVGAANPALNRNHVHPLQVEWPRREVQDQIVSVGAALDQKITLNNQINQTLEQMAQTLFKSWFVDFDPVKAKMNGEQPKGMDAPFLSKEVASLFPEKLVESELGLIPEGWDAVQVGDIVQRLKPKKRYTKKQVEPYGKTPVYEQGASILLGFHNDDAGFDASPEDPVFIFGDHTCITHLSCSKFDISSNVIPLKGSVRPTIWTYYAIQGKQEFQEYRRHWSEFIIKDVVLPPVELAEKYAELVTTKYLMMESLKRQSKELEQLRDTLLPKLLSGEIDLENLPVEQAKALAE
ncbi:restriction endonuclease subunit S [Vibrio sp. 10N.286.51.E5]|uniref:restriction endonuclease subunit S n=1 Tax=Vibrio sp. 10N.286.51.E5 TaxID=3229709 RepID=UPI00354C3B51